MEIDDETYEMISKYRNWHDGYFKGYEDAEVKSNLIIEELVRRIDRLEAQLSEFKNSDGSAL